MKLINPSVEIITPLDGTAILKHIEYATRTCYKSNDKTTHDSHLKLIKTILDSAHYSVCEHFQITFKVICSRACMAQWTRHRHMSYSIESQRYISYAKDRFGGEITFIQPVNFDKYSLEQKDLLTKSFQTCEDDYLALIKSGMVAQNARQVLNNAVKTEMVVSANLRSLREFLKLRTTSHAQDEVRYLAKDLLEKLQREIPIIFEDI
jgi:thymidylate synthase (FAD)